MPQNFVKAPIDNLATFISQSAKFQELVSAANATEALESIYFVEAPSSAVPTFAIVYTDGGQFTRTRVGSGPNFSTQQLRMGTWFALATPEAYHDDLEAAAEYHFGNFQTILDELEQIATSVLNVIEYSVEIFPVPAEEHYNEGDKHWGALVHWSVR